MLAAREPAEPRARAPAPPRRHRPRTDGPARRLARPLRHADRVQRLCPTQVTMLTIQIDWGNQ